MASDPKTNKYYVVVAREEYKEEDEENFPAENDEPSDFEMMGSFGTVWHDWL